MKLKIWDGRTPIAGPGAYRMKLDPVPTTRGKLKIFMVSDELANAIADKLSDLMHDGKMGKRMRSAIAAAALVPERAGIILYDRLVIGLSLDEIAEEHSMSKECARVYINKELAIIHRRAMGVIYGK